MGDTKTVLVTGATGTIGGAAAAALAARGAGVVLLGRNRERLEARRAALCADLDIAGSGCTEERIALLVLDFSDFDSVRRAADEAMARFATIDALILSVGHLVQNGPTILPNGHEVMFATSVAGPFLFTQLLMDRLRRSNAMVLQVIAPFYREMDWDDIESIRNHKTVIAYNRAKTCERIIAGEVGRRYAGSIASVAFNPSFVIDIRDPELKKRWPKGFFGSLWWMFAWLIAKPPAVAGEPIADIVLSPEERTRLNGALFKLRRRIYEPDKAMNDKASARRLWDELHRLTGLTDTAANTHQR